MTLAGDLKVAPETGDDSPDARSFRPCYGRLDGEQRKAWDAACGPRNEAFRRANLTGDALTGWKYQQYMKDYLRCISAVDESVGPLLDYLDRAGLADNTILMYTSDQGFHLGEHGWYDKRRMYGESLRMPLIVR